MSRDSQQSHVLCLTGGRSLNKRMSLFIEGTLRTGAGVTVVALPRGPWSFARFENDQGQADTTLCRCRFGSGERAALTAIFCFHWIMLPLAVLIGRLRSVPVIYDEHDHYEVNTQEGKRTSIRAWLSQKSVRWIHRCCLPFVSLVTCIHMYEALLSRHLQQWQPNVLELHNYPVGAWRSLSPPDDPNSPLCFIYMGGIYEEKGVRNAVEAFGKLPDALRRRCQLHLFGHGDEGLIRELKQRPEVSVHDSVTPEELRQFAAEHRCCGLVLYSEHPRYRLIGTNSRKLYEYLAMGLPVIVTRVGEIPTFIEKHDLGMVIDCRINVDELQEAMCRIAQSFETWRALSENASVLMSDPRMSWESEWNKVLRSGLLDTDRRAA